MSQRPKYKKTIIFDLKKIKNLNSILTNLLKRILKGFYFYLCTRKITTK